jgi:CRISPR/Cas system Type II protein with McrA/HNH and RuvC-like nuclease domain
MTVWKTERRSNVAAAQVTQKYTTKWLEFIEFLNITSFERVSLPDDGQSLDWRRLSRETKRKKIQRNWKWRDLICYRIQILCDCVKYILS